MRNNPCTSTWTCTSELCQWWAIVLQFETTPSSFSHELIVVSRLMAVWCPMAIMAITRLMVAGGATQLDASLRLGCELPMLTIAVAQRLRIGFQLHWSIANASESDARGQTSLSRGPVLTRILPPCLARGHGARELGGQGVMGPRELEGPEAKGLRGQEPREPGGLGFQV